MSRNDFPMPMEGRAVQSLRSNSMGVYHLIEIEDTLGFQRNFQECLVKHAIMRHVSVFAMCLQIPDVYSRRGFIHWFQLGDC